MTYPQDEADIRRLEDSRHARRGCCLSFVVVPPILLCICWAILTFTPNGQAGVAWGVLYFTRNGLGIHDAVGGYPGIARLSCQLDRQNPRPNNFQQLQDNLDRAYTQMVRAYGNAWQTLNSRGDDLSQFAPPDQVPSNLAGGKIQFCR